MNIYGEKIQLASMRFISWLVVLFSGKRGVYANSLSVGIECKDTPNMKDKNDQQVHSHIL